MSTDPYDEICPVTLPKVTLVTPSYNQAPFLERTLRSVLEQSYGNIEYIVIDGGSRDGSVEIIERYGRSLAYWVSEPDAGQADALNKGFARATGAYLGWINSDDVLYPDAVAKAVAFLEAHPETDFVYGDADHGPSENEVRRFGGKASTLETMLITFDVPVPQQGCLWRRSVPERVGGLDPRWQVVLDREFFLRIAERCRMAYLPETLGFFRQQPDAKSSAQQARWLEELPAMYEAFFARPGIGPALLALRSRSLGITYLRCAWLALKLGRYAAVAAFAGRALRHDPLLFFRKGFRHMLGEYRERCRDRRSGRAAPKAGAQP